MKVTYTIVVDTDDQSEPQDLTSIADDIKSFIEGELGIAVINIEGNKTP